MSIVDGKSFTEHFCIKPAQPIPKNATSTPTLLGYPFLPVNKDPSNQVAGYFLNGTGLDDVAILRITSFANETADPDLRTATFVNTTRDFLAAATAANKKKLIIDVSGNGGGNTILPNDVVSITFYGLLSADKMIVQTIVPRP